MKLYFCHIGKTKTTWINQGEQDYVRKLKRFGSVQSEYLKSSRSSNLEGHRKDDSSTLQLYLEKAPKAFNVLLDERGKAFTSKHFASFIDRTRNQNGPAIRFVTGGPYGVSDELRNQCDAVVRLSDMVMPHELVRVVLMEQVYRAFTILRGESYHHI